MEINKIYNMDCLEGMAQIPAGSVDLILCDPPFGTVKGLGSSTELRAFGEKCEWDTIIPTDKLFEQYERVLRRNGTVVLFSQEPYTTHLRSFQPKNLEFSYPMIYKKNFAGNFLKAKKAPLGYFEDINVWRKKVTLASPDHPLRSYFRAMLEYIGVNKTAITTQLGSRAQHCFNFDGNQFSIPTETTYNDIVIFYDVTDWDEFKTWEEVEFIDRKFKESYKDPDEVIFNLPEGRAYLSNVLEYAKEPNGFHPTQKPVALMQRLVLTYTHRGGLVLDSCMGSGSTAVACIREGRNFIGFELDGEYYEKACKRLEVERMRNNTLF